MKKFSLYTKVALFSLFPLALCGCDIWNAPLGDRVAFELKVKLVSSWAELEDAVNNAADGDIIAITRSFSTVDASGNSATSPVMITKDITITSYSGRETIYRENGMDWPFFGTANSSAHLTLGHPLGGTLVLDGKGILTSFSLVTVANEGSFTLADRAELRNNYNNINNGGAVSVGRNGTFVMTGGIISGNRAAPNANGGGVHLMGDESTHSSFTMTGGIISGNTAYKGGGVSIGIYNSFTKSGASSISGNTATAASPPKGQNVIEMTDDKYRDSDAGPGQDMRIVPLATGSADYSGFEN